LKKVLKYPENRGQLKSLKYPKLPQHLEKYEDNSENINSRLIKNQYEHEEPNPNLTILDLMESEKMLFLNQMPDIISDK